ncbi:thiamine diphosphokinase [Cytobacillus kochii]|uniref:thiamine diphosphokinase n=1 Tax=Cytobacillus kochii TaxID=859143 RepID=UPI001CD2A59B|nr:thiamine diphosphokinase [Cytobacillus kochii]MCA1028427.1 thiamine diphosphokinase [Cytobacillus kochii]MCM3321751.1 thiamine diphosphokinase [Cytobacillus kochii]MCM3343415.1 thiamine diphosphokinase [Cytobacillus kochii]
MKINILAGGPQQYLPNLNDYCFDEVLWIGVDRGAYTLIKKGIAIDYAFGDFDSVDESQYSMIKQHVPHLQRVKPEKDETDMELALLWAIEQKPEEITVFGATGGRLDHFFANTQLLIQPLLNDILVPICLVDKQNQIMVKKSGHYQIAKESSYPYISFIPVTENVRNLTLTGFKYPLTNHFVPLGSTLCISNELIDDNGTFSFDKGILMVIRSKDEK